MVDVVTMMHLGQQLDDALITKDFLMEDKELRTCRPMEDLQGFLAVGESSATGRSCERINPCSPTYGILNQRCLSTLRHAFAAIARLI